MRNLGVLLPNIHKKLKNVSEPDVDVHTKTQNHTKYSEKLPENARKQQPTENQKRTKDQNE